jgi:DNA-binding MarR family transcriptional regulator
MREERDMTVASQQANQSPPNITIHGWSPGSVVHRADRAFARALEARLVQFDISMGMYHFLRLLWIADGGNQKQLGEEAGLRPSTTGVALDNMEQRGLIDRHRNRTDRRMVNVFLTDKGRALRDRIFPQLAELNRIALQGLDPVECAQLKDLLTRVTQSLEAFAAGVR